MNLDATNARSLLKRLDPDLLFPGLDPSFVSADSRREEAGKPLFFSYESGTCCYYLAGILRNLPQPFEQFVDLQSPHGYGGAISTSDDRRFLSAAEAALSEYMKGINCVATFMRFHPTVGNQKFSLAPTFRNRSTVSVDLRGDFFSKYETRARTAVRKAERQLSLHIVSGADVAAEALQSAYTDAMLAIGAERFYHFPVAYFSELLAMPDVFVVFARHQSTSALAGFAIFLVLGSMGEYHLAGTTELGRHTGAANLIITAGLSEMQNRRVTRAHLGGGRTTEDKDSLLLFKSGFSPWRTDFAVGGGVFNEAVKKDLHGFLIRNRITPNNRILFYRN